MSSRIANIAIDAVQPRVVADFWCRALGWRVVEEDDGVISIAAPDGCWPMIDVVPVPEAKTVKNRLHLDLRADGLPTADELERLLDLGARRVDVGQAPDVTWVVLADPEGNEFCLLSRTVQEAHADRKEPDGTEDRLLLHPAVAGQGGERGRPDPDEQTDDHHGGDAGCHSPGH